MKDEDYYRSLSIEISDESSHSDTDANVVAKSLQDIDDLDANLFGGALKKNNKELLTSKGQSQQATQAKDKLDKEKLGPVASKKKKSLFDDGLDFDDDDPLAGLLSDEDESSKKTTWPSKDKPIAPKKISSAEVKNTNHEVKTKSPLHAKKKDLDFGTDDDLLDTLGLHDSPLLERKKSLNVTDTFSAVESPKTPKRSVGRKSRSFFDILQEDTALLEGPKKSSDDILFGSYVPSLANTEPSVSKGRRNEKFENELPSSSNQNVRKQGGAESRNLDSRGKPVTVGHSTSRNGHTLDDNLFASKETQNYSNDAYQKDKKVSFQSEVGQPGNSNVRNDQIKLNAKPAVDDWLGSNVAPRVEPVVTNEPRRRSLENKVGLDWLETSNTSLAVDSADKSDVKVGDQNQRRSSISWLESDDSAFQSRITSTPLLSNSMPEEQSQRNSSEKKQAENIKKTSEITQANGGTKFDIISSTRNAAESFGSTLMNVQRNHLTQEKREDSDIRVGVVPGFLARSSGSGSVGNSKLDSQSRQLVNLDLSSDSTTTILKLQNKIEIMDNERQHLITSSQSLQSNYQQQLAALIEAHQAQIKHMDQDFKNQNQRLVQEKEDLYKEYSAKVNEWNKERMEQMVSYQSKLDSIQKHWMEEVDELKKLERQTSSEMKLYLEKYYENLNLRQSQNSGDDVQGSTGLEQVMKNCLDLLKQHSEELKALKQQLEEERWANVKENEAVLHRKKVELQKEQQNEIENEWKKLEASRKQFHDDQNQWKEQLKEEIEEFIKAQCLKEQQTVQNWEDYTQFNSDNQTERNDEMQYGNHVQASDWVDASQQEFVNKVSSLEEELINLEKDRRKFMEDQRSLQNLAEQVKQRSNEAEEMCMIASKIREEGLTALEKAEKVKQEHKVLAASIQKQMQVLRNKEEFLNKERIDLLSQTGNHPIYYLCKNCLQLNIEEKDLLHPRQTESTTDAMRSYHYLGNMNTRQAMSMLSGLDSVEMPDNFVSSSFVSGNGVADHSLMGRSLHASRSNFNETVDVISWQMVAEKDRETLENEKQFLTSLLLTGNPNS